MNTSSQEKFYHRAGELAFASLQEVIKYNFIAVTLFASAQFNEKRPTPMESVLIYQEFE